MKKSPPTPDVNANAPRPRRVSSDDRAVPTMDVPPGAPSDTATGFDRATAATDQEYRSGLLPGYDDTTASEYTLNEDDDAELESDSEFWPYDKLEPGADIEQDVEFDPELDSEESIEPAADDVIEPPLDMDPTLAAELRTEGQTFPQQDDPDQEGPLDEDSARPNEDHPANPNHERINDPENETLGAVKPPDKR